MFASGMYIGKISMNLKVLLKKEKSTSTLQRNLFLSLENALLDISARIVAQKEIMFLLIIIYRIHPTEEAQNRMILDLYKLLVPWSMIMPLLCHWAGRAYASPK